MTLIALETIRHNGAVYKPGDSLEKLTKKEEKRLVELKSAEYKDAKPPSPEELLAKELDKKYNRNPLAEAAVAASVEFSEDATKAVLIAAIIEQGKAEELLQTKEGE